MIIITIKMQLFRKFIKPTGGSSYWGSDWIVGAAVTGEVAFGWDTTPGMIATAPATGPERRVWLCTGLFCWACWRITIIVTLQNLRTIHDWVKEKFSSSIRTPWNRFQELLQQLLHWKSSKKDKAFFNSKDSIFFKFNFTHPLLFMSPGLFIRISLLSVRLVFIPLSFHPPLPFLLSFSLLLLQLFVFSLSSLTLRHHAVLALKPNIEMVWNSWTAIIKVWHFRPYNVHREYEIW